MRKSGWAALGLAAVWGMVVPVSAQTVTKELLEQDLAYVVETVSEVHPALVEAGRREVLGTRASSLLQALPDELPLWRVGVTVAEPLRTLDDGHTQTDLTFGSVRYLPVQFAWLADGLIVAPVPGSDVNIPVASEVLNVGGLEVTALEQKLARLVPENLFAVREAADALTAESVLRWLGVVERDAVTLEVRTPAGEVETLEVGLTGAKPETSGELEKMLSRARGLARERDVENRLLAYRVDAEENYGVFWLKTCENTDEYRFFVKRFFQVVAAKGIDHVVVSVQQNGGGNSGVVDALLAHLPVKRYTSFSGAARFSKTVLQRIEIEDGLRDATPEELERVFAEQGEPLLRRLGDVFYVDHQETPVERASPTLHGTIYVLTDSGSFSAAVDLGTVLRDNRLAEIAGEPTGGMPTSYGDLLRFTTPRLELPFSVSHKYFVRPDPSRDPADTLMPDVPLPITVKDVQTGHSPVLGWLESLNRP